MDVRPLLNESDLDWALAEIRAYFDNQPAPGSPDAARYDVLAALIENYEDRHWPIQPPVSVRSGRSRKNYKAHTSWRMPDRKLVRHRAAA